MKPKFYFQIVLFLLISLLSGITNMTVWAQGQEGNPLTADLPFVQQIEPEVRYQALEAYSRSLYDTFKKSQKATNYINGYDADGDLNAKMITEIMEWDKTDIEDYSPLWNSDFFVKYYKIRTEKLTDAYKKTGKFDYDKLIQNAKGDFDSFLKNRVANAVEMDKLTLKLQDKMTDKMLYDNAPDRSRYFDSLLALRQKGSEDKKLSYIYQIFEYRTRCRVMESIIASDKEKITAAFKQSGTLLKSPVGLLSEAKGTFSVMHYNPRSKDYSIIGRAATLQAGYQYFEGRISLGDILSHTDIRIYFIEDDGSVYLIPREKALAHIRLGKEGATLNITELLQNILREAYIPSQPAPQIKGADPDIKEQLEKQDLVLQKNIVPYLKSAQGFVKELNKYSIYLALKDKAVTNNYTKSFEGNKKNWHQSMETALKIFKAKNDTDNGMAGFMAFIKRYVNYSRERAEQDVDEGWAVLKLRDSILQFRPIEEANLWLLDMIYRVKYMN